jgi:predicted metal-dependent HD superfamily phosphohydrolase
VRRGPVLVPQLVIRADETGCGGSIARMDTDRAAAVDPIDVEVGFLTPALRSDLLERWNEPQRRYHNETHLRAVLRAVDALEADGEAFDATEVRLAAWLHAAVFDPTESENNERSAVFCERVLDPSAPVEEVARLVRLMGGHRVEVGDLNGAVLSDADLAVLGSDPETYDTYAADVRHEFAHVPGERFVAGRIVALEGLLERKSVYLTRAGRDMWEKQAHANLNRELGLLRAGAAG